MVQEALDDAILRLKLYSDNLPIQGFLLVSRLCVLSTVTHLLRTCAILPQQLELFDMQFRDIMLKKLHLDSNTHPFLLSLPVRDGGLGFPALSLLSPVALCGSYLDVLCGGVEMVIMWRLLMKEMKEMDILKPSEEKSAIVEGKEKVNDASIVSVVARLLSGKFANRVKLNEGRMEVTIDGVKMKEK